MFGFVNFANFSADSRKKFDVYYRRLLNGDEREYPKPQNFRMAKHQLFPDKATVYEFICDTKTGQWMPWLDTIEKVPLPLNAKVRWDNLVIIYELLVDIYLPYNNSYCTCFFICWIHYRILIWRSWEKILKQTLNWK